MPGFMRAIRKLLSPGGGGGLDLPELGMRSRGFEEPPPPMEEPTQVPMFRSTEMFVMPSPYEGEAAMYGEKQNQLHKLALDELLNRQRMGPEPEQMDLPFGDEGESYYSTYGNSLLEPEAALGEGDLIDAEMLMPSEPVVAPDRHRRWPELLSRGLYRS